MFKRFLNVMKILIGVLAFFFIPYWVGAWAFPDYNAGVQWIIGLLTIIGFCIMAAFAYFTIRYIITGKIL